jgi:hypothetical protein
MQEINMKHLTLSALLAAILSMTLWARAPQGAPATSAPPTDSATKSTKSSHHHHKKAASTSQQPPAK